MHPLTRNRVGAIALAMLFSCVCMLLTLSGASTASAQSTARSGDADLRREVRELQAIVRHQQVEIGKLKSDLAKVRKSDLFDLARHITLDRDASGFPRILISGVNVQIINGVNQDTANGVGNLIVGFNERTDFGFTETCSNFQLTSQAECVAAGFVWGFDFKTGSHNLVVGNRNSYGSTGGVVFGFRNVITAPFSVVSAGEGSYARAPYSSVGGGFRHSASGEYSSITGGLENSARGRFSSVTAGTFQAAIGHASSITGGANNEALAAFATVSGGAFNTATAGSSTVSGGFERTAPGNLDWVGGEFFSEQ